MARRATEDDAQPIADLWNGSISTSLAACPGSILPHMDKEYAARQLEKAEHIFIIEPGQGYILATITERGAEVVAFCTGSNKLGSKEANATLHSCLVALAGLVEPDQEIRTQVPQDFPLVLGRQPYLSRYTIEPIEHRAGWVWVRATARRILQLAVVSP